MLQFVHFDTLINNLKKDKIIAEDLTFTKPHYFDMGYLNSDDPATPFTIKDGERILHTCLRKCAMTYKQTKYWVYSYEDNFDDEFS